MIVPFVEGHAERESVPTLIRRILHDQQVYGVAVQPGVRVPRDKLVKQGELERRIKLARLMPNARAVAVLVDADDDCPKALGPDLMRRGVPVAAGMAFSVVLAKIEIEAWFIAGIESLRTVRGIRDDATPPADPENIRDAKGWLTAHMNVGKTYVPVDDQATFASAFDYHGATTRSRSLTKFVKDITAIGRQLSAQAGL